MGTCNSVARVDDVFFIPLSAMVIMIAAITVTKLIVPMQDVSFYSHVLFVLSFLTAGMYTSKTPQTCRKLSILPDCNKLDNFIKLQQVC